MLTLKLGFALEGNSDYPVIPCLARRLISEAFQDVTLAPDAELRPRKRGHGFIKELPALARQLRDVDVDMLVVVVDTDQTQLRERKALLEEAKSRCAERQIPVCIADGLAVRSLEAWLLADEEAIFRTFDGDRAGLTFPRCEQDPVPKQTLNQIVRKLTDGREISFASYARELSEAIRLNILRQRCPHFDEFARNLINCVREQQRARGARE